MVQEFPDHEKRVAVCYSQWRKDKKVMKQTDEFFSLIDQKLKKFVEK